MARQKVRRNAPNEKTQAASDAAMKDVLAAAAHDDLDTALDRLFDGVWADEGNEGECPHKATPRDLVDWLIAGDCPTAVRRRSEKMLCAALGKGWKWPTDHAEGLHPILTGTPLSVEFDGELITRDECRYEWRLIRYDWLMEPDAWKAAQPLVKAWMAAAPLRKPKVTAAGRGYTRRAVAVSQMMQVAWRDEGPLSAVVVDGEPMAAQLRNWGLRAAQPWPHESYHKRKKLGMRALAPDKQMPLKIAGVPAIPRDMRLAALSGFDSPILVNDMHTLMTAAQSMNPPGVILSLRAGAKILARTRDGGYRNPKRSDIQRFLDATAALQGLALYYLDDQDLSRWREMADVRTTPNRNIILAPPSWMLSGQGTPWRLTAEGGLSGRARVTAGEGGTAGRMVTGIEHRLASRWDGRKGIAPDMRAKAGKPGNPVFVPWRDTLWHRGDVWDVTDPKADHAAGKRYRASAERLCNTGYVVVRHHHEAEAGDAIEIVRMTKGGRGREAGLWVRASARMVEAAKQANRADGRGFSTMTLEDWLGYDGSIVDADQGSAED